MTSAPAPSASSPSSCQDATCTTPPRWRLTDTSRPGLVLYACAAHLLPLLTSSTTHVLEELPGGQPA